MAAAAGPSDGELMIETDGDNLGASHIVTGNVSGNAIKVPSLRLQRILDDAGVSHVDALKIDVEGFEDRVLTGFFKEAPPSLWPRAVVIEHLSRNEWLGRLHRRHAARAATPRPAGPAATRCWFAVPTDQRPGAEHRRISAVDAAGTKSGNSEMPIDPQEDPPIKPGQPSEPPQEGPPGNPRPEVPPPMQDPGEPPRPQELPGNTPDELPVRGPRTAHALSCDRCRYGRLAGIGAGSEPGAPDMPQGTMQTFGLKRSSECAMNKGTSGLSAPRNKNKSAFEGRHNPA